MLASDLLECLEIERRFKNYKLEWMSKEPGMYYLAMVRDFYDNYVAVLEKGASFDKGTLVRLSEVIVKG